MGALSLTPDDVVYFFATSRDGYVADANGGGKWMQGYFIPEMGFHDLLAEIRNVVMGGLIWSATQKHGQWPYGAIPGAIAAGGPVSLPGARLQAVSGSGLALINAAKTMAPGPTWLVGDNALALSLARERLITRIIHFTMPETLSAGADRLPPDLFADFAPIDKQLYPNQVERQSYAPRAS